MALFVESVAESTWWGLSVIRDSGRWLGVKVFEAFERGGVDYGVILGEGFPWFVLALVVTAIGLGAGIWLTAQLVISWCLRCWPSGRRNRRNRHSLI